MVTCIFGSFVIYGFRYPCKLLIIIKQVSFHSLFICKYNVVIYLLSFPMSRDSIPIWLFVPLGLLRIHLYSNRPPDTVIKMRNH